MSEDPYKATKGDIFGIIDYLRVGSTLLRLAQSTNKGDDMTAISVGFELTDAEQCMPHLKGVMQASCVR
jgi:hypothetical protein